MATDLNLTNPRKLDADLVRRALAGDEEAFATLYNAHRNKVYALCLRMTSNTAEAEDLTQDAFLQVFRKLATFRGDSALSTWLYRVAVNTVLMHFRKKGLRQVSLEEPSSREEGSPKREFGTIDGRLSTVVERVTLTRAMEELPAGYRTIFVLHEVRGFEHHEIARLLGCSIGNSKSQLHKAKTRMRDLLGARSAKDEARALKQASRSRRKPVLSELPAPVVRTESWPWDSTSEAAA